MIARRWLKIQIGLRKNGRTLFHVRYYKGSKFIDRNFYGKIVLKGGDTLRGMIRTTGFGCMFLESNKFKSMFIPVDDINYISGDDVVSLGQNLYVLKKFHNHRDLYRLVERKGKIAIYDLQPNDFRLYAELKGMMDYILDKENKYK